MEKGKLPKSATFTGVFAAISASSCCIPPVIALIAGVGGSASVLSWMDPFRPYLIGLAVIAIGYAWYSFLKFKNTDNCNCDVDEKPKWFQTKGFLIGITLFAAISISFPYYAHAFYPDNKKEVVITNASHIQNVNFKVEGMTCASCEANIKYSVNKLEGILTISVSYEKGNAEIKFDTSKTSIDDIEKAVNSTGYKVIKIQKNE